MSLESGNFIKNLVATNPEGTDPKSQGDDHLRLIKAVLLSQFASFTDGIPLNKTESQINAMLLQGAWGLGGSALVFTDANTIPFESGFYHYGGTPGAGNLPGGAVAGDTLLQICPNGVLCTQLYTAINTGQVWVRRFASGWLAWQPYVIGPKQAHVLDVTANCVLQVGAFGLGGRGETSGAQNLDQPNPYTYIIGIQPGMSGTIPPGGNPADMCLSMCFNSAKVYQVYFSFSNGLMWHRTYNSGWNGWQIMDPLGVAQTWQNVTASRAIGTQYTNNTNRAIQVCIGGTTAGVNGSGSLNISATIAHGLAWSSVSGNLPWTVSCVVPAGAPYAMTLTAGGLSYWSELR